MAHGWALIFADQIFHPGTFNMDGISGYISDSSETRSGGNSPALNTLSEEFLKKLRDKRMNVAAQRSQAVDEPREMSGLEITGQLDPVNIKMEALIDNGEDAAHSTTDQPTPVTMLPQDSISDPVKSRKSRSRSSSRSASRSKSRSPKPSSRRHRSRSESPKRRKHSRSRTPRRKRRSRSRSRSPTPRRSHRSRSRTPKRKSSRSKTPKRKRRSKSRTPRRSRSRSPKRRRRSRSRSRSRSPSRRRRSRSKTPTRRRRRSVTRSSDKRRKHSRSRSRDRKRRRSRSYSRERRRSSDRSRRRKHNRSRSRSRSKTRSKSKSLSRSRSPSPHRACSSDDQLNSLASKLDVLAVQVARLETVQGSMVQALNNLIHLVQSLRHQQQPTASDNAWSPNQSFTLGGRTVTTTPKQMFPTPGAVIPIPKIKPARRNSLEGKPVLAGRIGQDDIVQLGLPLAEPPVLINHTFLQKALGVSPDAKTYACKLLKHLFTEEEMSKCNFEGRHKMQGGVTEKLDPLRLNAILSQVELDFPGCMAPKELALIRKAVNAACRAVRFKTRMQNPPSK